MRKCIFSSRSEIGKNMDGRQLTCVSLPLDNADSWTNVTVLCFFYKSLCLILENLCFKLHFLMSYYFGGDQVSVRPTTQKVVCLVIKPSNVDCPTPDMYCVHVCLVCPTEK